MLSPPVLIAGALFTTTATGWALRRLDTERIPQAAMLAAAFFVASLITVPVGPSSVHLVLNGLMGLILGSAAVPALLVALLLQAVFFGFGGLIVLGVNAMNVALPALACGLLLRPALARAGCPRARFRLGATAGALGAALSGLLVALTLALSGADLVPAAQVIALTYLPLIVAEAAVAGTAVTFLSRVAPELLPRPEPADG